MHILVIRHGESEADLMDVHEGRADFNLTEKGERQARAMSAWVKARYTLNKIYSSPLKRAYQTATQLALATRLTPVLDDKLMEFNNGLIAGLKRKTADERYPFVSDVPVHEAVYEQESKLDFRFRAEYMLSKIISESKSDDTVAVISHGGMINQMFRAFIGAPMDSRFFCSTGDTGIHEWVVKSNLRQIVFANSCEHIAKL